MGQGLQRTVQRTCNFAAGALETSDTVTRTSKTTGQQLYYCSLIFQVERESRLRLVYLGASRKKLLHGKGTWVEKKMHLENVRAGHNVSVICYANGQTIVVVAYKLFRKLESRKYQQVHRRVKSNLLLFLRN
jgi:hypothetical protein